MGKQKSQYEQILDKTSIWLQQAIQRDTLSAIEVVDKAKAYLHAAEALTADEIQTLERFLLKDFQAFAHEMAKDADDSLWWQTTKQGFWQLLGTLADKNKMEWVELQVDLAKAGVYQAGDLIAIGELICDACDQRVQVSHVQRVSECIRCGHNRFHRSA